MSGTIGGEAGARQGRWSLTVVLLGATVLGGCFTPPVVLETRRAPLELDKFPPGTELLELPVAPETSVRGVFVPAIAAAAGARPAPVVLDFLASSVTLLDGARATGFKVSVTVDTGDTPFTVECGSEGAPPESQGSPFPLAHRWLLQLPLLGCSAMAVDYEGVGASDGERSPDTLRRDAHAAWDEAVRRAGGDAARVVLRGSSLGSLVIAALLQDGARPGGVMLLAPVRDETVVHNGAAAMRGPWTARLGAWLFRDPVGVDLLAELREARVPLLVVVPNVDDFLPHDERVALRDAVAAAGGTFVVRHEDHIALALAGRSLLDTESWFLGRLPCLALPAAGPARLQAELAAWDASCAKHADPAPCAALAAPSARARLATLLDIMPLAVPGAAGALAVNDTPAADRAELLDLLAWLPPERRAGLDPPALASLFALGDPAGPLPVSALADLRNGRADLGQLSAAQVADLLATILASPPSFGHGFSASITGDVVMYGDWMLPAVQHAVTALQDAGMARADARRRELRLMLKAAGIPERVTTAGGVSALEVFEAGAWRTLAVP